MRESSSGSRRNRSLWLVAGVAAFVVVGGGLLGAGFLVGRLARDSRSSPVATPAPSTLPTAVGTFPTYTPLPVATSLPTATPLQPTATLPQATESVAVPVVVAQGDGVNVRSGPGESFPVIGRLEPDAQAQVAGRYGDWWQIDYDGTPGWVAGWVVTASDTEDVPEVVPPPSPIPSTAAPAPTKTPVPPTSAPADCRGVVGDSFQVEGAPGPYSRGAAGAEIWFNLWVTNGTGSDIEYKSLGVAALRGSEQTDYQNSYSWSTLLAHKQFHHRDHIFIEEPGAYQLWLRIGFLDDYWCSLAGPVEVIVQ
jgi:hypothetical protein